MKKYLSIIIPAYNESTKIIATLDEIWRYLSKQKYTFEIIVVNDGSRDQTVEMVSNWMSGKEYCQLIDNQNNHGKGWVVKHGMLVAVGQWRLFMDADNSTRISELDNFMKYTGDFDIIIGSRYTEGRKFIKKQPWFRVIFARIANSMIKILAVKGIADTQCGFKLFRGEVADKVFKKQRLERWGFDFELLAIAKRMGYKIKELPVVWKYSGKSSVTTGAALKTILELFKVRWNIIRGKYN